MKIAISDMELEGKIPSGSSLWPQFNASFQNVDIAPIDVAYEVCTGHAVTTWHANRWRHSDNYILGQHIGLDFDTEDERSTFDALKRHAFIRDYAFMIHTTPSHRPEKPRARVIFELDEPIYQASNYSRAAKALVWLFNGADSKCKDPARFFYGSLNCQHELLYGTLPLSTVKQIIRDYEASGASARRKYEQEHGMPSNMKASVETCIRKAAYGDRNNLGFWLANRCQEEGLPRTEAEQLLRIYQQSVTHLGSSPYTEIEALASVRSAYR